jgi:hypothetical protein
MSEIVIDIDDYLTEDDKRDLVREAFRNEASRQMNRDTIDRFISNMSYEMVHRDINQVTLEYDRKLREGVEKVVNDITSYIVFSYDNDSYARQQLNKAVDANAGKIQAKIGQLVEDLSEYDIGEMVSDHVKDAIREAFSK